MRLQINKNLVDAKLLAMPLSDFTETTDYAVTAIKENYEYLDGKRTDKWLSSTISCVDTVSFATINIKVTQRIALVQQEIDETDDNIFIQIDLGKTFVRPYSIEYGKAKVSIVTDSVKVIRE